MPTPDISEATPILTSGQWSRLHGYGTAHHVEVGELLFRPRDASCDLILTGSWMVDIVRAKTSDSAEAVVASGTPDSCLARGPGACDYGPASRPAPAAVPGFWL